MEDEDALTCAPYVQGVDFEILCRTVETAPGDDNLWYSRRFLPTTAYLRGREHRCGVARTFDISDIGGEFHNESHLLDFSRRECMSTGC